MGYNKIDGRREQEAGSWNKILHNVFHCYSEVEDSNGSLSSDEELDTLEYAKSLAFKQSIPKKSISQIIKDKKKQTQLTLQW